MNLYNYIDNCAADAVQEVFEEWTTYKYDLDGLIEERIQAQCEIIYYADAYDIVEEARHNWGDWLNDAERNLEGQEWNDHADHTMALASEFLRDVVTSFFMQRESGRLLMGV